MVPSSIGFCHSMAGRLEALPLNGGAFLVDVSSIRSKTAVVRRCCLVHGRGDFRADLRND